MKVKDYRLLLVDDNPKNIQVLAAVLSENGFEFEYAKSGQQALLWLDEEDFDLVLLDVMMPGMDGFETCQKIREQKKHKDLPILFLTARTDNESVLKGFQVGGQDYISKPFQTDELLARCNTHLELKKRKEELTDLNQWLQQEVLNRSKQLKETNKRLLNAKVQLDNMDDVKIEFLQIISHEIRTPLNHIVGFNAMLQEMDLDETSSKYMEYINNSVHRLEGFSYKALDITQLRALGEEALRPKEVVVGDFLSEVITNSENCPANCVHIENDQTSSVKLQTDPRYLEKAIMALINNSLSHCGTNCQIKISINQTDSNIELLISDNGPGFSQKALDSLFKPVSPGVMHIDSDNVGLGLYYTQLFMEAQKGSIQAGNDPEGGAWVKLSFNSGSHQKNPNQQNKTIPQS